MGRREAILILLFTVALFMLSTLNAPILVKVICIIHAIAFTIALMEKPKDTFYRIVNIKFWYILLLTFNTWVAGLLLNEKPFSLSVDTLIVSVLSGVTTISVALWLGATLSRDNAVGLDQLLGYIFAGYGLMTLIAYITLSLGLQQYTTFLVYPLIFLRRRELKVEVPSGAYLRYVLTIFLPLLISFSITTLNLFNPFTDQICFIARAIWKDKEVDFSTTFTQPLGSYMPEYLSRKLFPHINPWVAGLTLYPLHISLVFLTFMEFMRWRLGVPTANYKWLLVGDLTTSVLIYVGLTKGNWTLEDYINFSWYWPAGLIAEPHILAFMKDTAVIVGTLVSLATPSIVTIFLYIYIMAQQPVLGMALSLLPILSNRRRDVVLGCTVGSLPYVISPSIVLEDLSRHTQYVGNLPLLIAAYAAVAMGVTLTDIPQRLMDSLNKGKLISMLTAILVIASFLSPHALPQLLESVSIQERAFSILGTLKYLVLPWSLWLIVRPPKVEREAFTLFLITVAFTLFPIVFYEPLRVVSVIPFVFMFLSSHTEMREPFVPLLIMLSIPTGTIGYIAMDNLKWVDVAPLAEEIPDDSLVVSREWSIFAKVMEKGVWVSSLRKGANLAMLMSPDPAIVLTIYPKNKSIFEPTYLRNANYSYLGFKKGTYTSSKGCVEIPERIDRTFLERIWGEGAMCYVKGGEEIRPRFGDVLTMVVHVKNAKIITERGIILAEDAAIYPSLGYAYIVGKFKTNLSLGWDPVSISPYFPGLYFPSTPKESGVTMTVTLFRPYNFTQYTVSGIHPFINFMVGDRNVWLEGNVSIGYLNLSDGLYWVYIHRYRGDNHSVMLFPMIYYSSYNVTAIPLPARIEGHSETIGTLRMHAIIDEFIREPFKYESLSIGYATGSLLIGSSR
ncbi:MAG: hypothetical protein QXR62_03685 [Candidatus Bathyarchaeia archaeon]